MPPEEPSHLPPAVLESFACCIYHQVALLRSAPSAAIELYGKFAVLRDFFLEGPSSTSSVTSLSDGDRSWGLDRVHFDTSFVILQGAIPLLLIGS